MGYNEHPADGGTDDWDDDGFTEIAAGGGEMFAANAYRDPPAEPDGMVVEVVRRLVRDDAGHIIESSMRITRIPDPRVPADHEEG